MQDTTTPGEMPEHEAPKYLGVTWYREEAYQELRDMMVDRRRLDKTYAQWLRRAITVEQKVRESGYVPIRVYLEVEPFAAFCFVHLERPDGKGRARYCAKRTEEIVSALDNADDPNGRGSPEDASGPGT